VSLSRYEEAEGAFTDAVTAFDEALSRAPDHIQVHNNKCIALHRHGNLLAVLFRDDEAEAVYTDAVVAFDEALSRAPDDIYAYNTKGVALLSFGDLLASLSHEEEAEGAYTDAVAAFDEALSRAPDYTTPTSIRASRCWPKSICSPPSPATRMLKAPSAMPLRLSMRRSDVFPTMPRCTFSSRNRS
jgi:tetratricopeptide (TPR) repeat protein